MKLEMEIHTNDIGLICDLLEKEGSIGENDEIKISNHAKLIYKGYLFQKGIGIPDIHLFILSFSSGVAGGVIANWVYDKLRGKKVERLVFERTEVEVERGEIKRVINEILKF